MPLKKFTKTKEFKIFLTAFIVYIFYLQMYGSSCMANSQSGLTAAIVNEGRFKVDTYYRTSCDVAYYKGHYYSGQPPGISFLGAPFYAASKPFFNLLPDKTIDSLYSKLEKYGDRLGMDYWGKKKILSNYFEGLSKRQILEYIFISGFVLPISTTALIGAISVVLFYAFLRRFTQNEKLRLGITALYAFGTAQFPSSALFMERPIAIALTFAAFFVLFRMKHNELKPKTSALFFSGLLAGLSGMFDYFHVFASGLLFLYLLSFYVIQTNRKTKRWTTYLNRQKWSGIASFVAGVSICVILLGLYHYAIFDNPLKTSYSYRIVSASDASISDIVKLKLPSSETLFYMWAFILYTPVILVAVYGVYKALLKKDRYYGDAISIAIFVAFTLVYAAILALVYPVGVAPHFKRHMSPIIPYVMLFLPYALVQSSKTKRSIAKKILLIVGASSVFINWVHVQQKLDFLELMRYFFTHGPSSSFLEAFAGVFRLNSLVINLVGLAVLILLICIIWKPYFAKARQQL
ncbi:hypothetical protein HYW20_08275 [Candidatus Woesearchaeota archaeon]|nr:hypothetical protein [Candidatus Woesearchaeota archaeon]